MARYEDTDRVYHGKQHFESDYDERDWQPARIVVETPEKGPTERQRVKVLRKLPPPDDGHFGWGYNGGGTQPHGSSDPGRRAQHSVSPLLARTRV